MVIRSLQVESSIVFCCGCPWPHGGSRTNCEHMSYYLFTHPAVIEQLYHSFGVMLTSLHQVFSRFWTAGHTMRQSEDISGWMLIYYSPSSNGETSTRPTTARLDSLDSLDNIISVMQPFRTNEITIQQSEKVNFIPQLILQDKEDQLDKTGYLNLNDSSE